MRKLLAVLSTVLILATTAFALASLSRTITPERENVPIPQKVLGISEDLSITNSIISNVNEGNGVFLIKYQYTITHVGNYPALNLSANSWFNDTLENTFEVVDLSTNSSLTLNSGFDGKSNRSLLSGSNFLPANSSAQITLTIRLTYRDQNRQFVNFVDTAGDSGNSSSSSSSASASSSASSSSSSVGTSTSSGTTPTGTSSTSSSASTSITISVSTSTSAPGSGGNVDGLYDAAQVAFVLPSGQVFTGFIGKGE